MNDMKPEIIDVFNERMEHIGCASRKEVHEKGLWHKVFHCWIITQDEEGNQYLIFQLRSPQKESVPNSLDISAAGHLKKGETPIQGLRELREELGVEVTEQRLAFLGVHVEVWCEENRVNREFDYVYFLREDKNLYEYKVQPSEVTGLAKIKIDDGIKLFTKEVSEINAYSVHFDKRGMAIDYGFNQKLSISSFAGGERNNYYIKVLLLAKQYFNGNNTLFI